MLFKPTDSIITRPDPLTSNKKSKQKRNNLLDLLQHKSSSSQQQTQNDIQTFQQFKQSINKFDFIKNQQLKTSTSNKLSSKIMLRPKYSLGANIDRQKQQKQQNNNINYFNQRIQIPYTTQTSIYQPNSATLGVGGGGYLNIIKQQLYSRNSRKRYQIQQQNNLNTGLTLTYQVNQQVNKDNQRKDKSKDNNYNQGDFTNYKRKQSFQQNNYSIYKSSAHSSRSFNGFQQINQYQINQKIGSGAFSIVHLCRDIHTNKKYAMKSLSRKKFQKKLFRKNSVALADNYMNNQIAILKKMQHPYIIKLYQVIEDDVKNKIYLILEYCSGGYINQIKPNNQINQLKISGNYKYKRLLQSQCKRYFKQISLAMDYIHNIAKIAHRDIKPQNILLSQKDQIKISDFGLGTQDIQINSKSGTKGYIPPQSRSQDIKNSTTTTNPTTNIKITSQMADIWALGITLLVMLSGKSIQIQDNKLQNYISNLKDISNDCKDFLYKCLKINPNQRITASEMINHQWIMAKKIGNYNQIEISKEEQQQAISRRNRDILTQITRIHLSKHQSGK